MRILFLLRNFSGYYRQFESAIDELLRRGHEIHIGRERQDSMDGEQWALTMKERYAGQLTWSHTPHPQADGEWFALRRKTRLTRDYVHFLGPEFAQSPEFVDRARRRAPDRSVRFFEPRAMRTPRARRTAQRALYAVEDAMPPNQAVMDYIEAQRPDMVLLTPHLMPGSLHTEYVRCAQALGLRTGLCVASWDNLSSKQIIRVVPDVVTVWNETQKDEALRMHGLPPDRIAVTGAQVYDHWFRWPPRSREAFCERVGLPQEGPFILYAAGALFPARITEAQFAVEWLRRLRACDHPAVREAAVLVRPHPKRAAEWEEVDLGQFENVVLWPREGRMPVAQEAKADFFDSIHHSAAVFGVNTSAMIEAGILGRRVHTQLVPEFSTSQGGTLHFRYLTDVGGGLLEVAHSCEESFAQLECSLNEGVSDTNPNRRFVEAFVRPRGLDRPAAPELADAIERAASHGPAPIPEPALRELALRAALRPVAREMGRKGQLAHARKAARKLQKQANRIVAPGREAASPPSENAIDKLRAAALLTRDSDAPVLAGPFLGATAEELMYWIPHLAWAVEKHPELAKRMTVISLPGTAAWYRHLSAEQVELDVAEAPARVSLDAQAGAERSSSDAIRARVAEEGGLGEGYQTLDPALLSDAYEHLRERGAIAKIKKKSGFAHRPLTRPEVGALDGLLPDRYVAVDLPPDASLPATLANTDFLRGVIERLAGESSLVVYGRAPEDLPAGVTRLDELAERIGELGARILAVSRSQGLVATPSGLGFLGPMLGIPTIALYDPAATVAPHHLELARRVFGRDGFARFRALAVGDPDLSVLLAQGGTWSWDEVPA